MMVKSCSSGATNFLDKYPILLPSTMMDAENSSLVQPSTCSSQNAYQGDSHTQGKTETTLRLDRMNANAQELHPSEHSSAEFQQSHTEFFKFPSSELEMNHFSILTAISETQNAAQGTLLSLKNEEDSAEDQGKASPPTFADIVCSRGKRFFRHPGNERFRQIIHQSVQEYIEAETRMDKSIVIDSIIDSVRSQDESRLVRFMKYQSKSNTWTELPLEQIRDKVSHALRDAVNGLDRKNNTAV